MRYLLPMLKIIPAEILRLLAAPLIASRSPNVSAGLKSSLAGAFSLPEQDEWKCVWSISDQFLRQWQNQVRWLMRSPHKDQYELLRLTWIHREYLLHLLAPIPRRPSGATFIRHGSYKTAPEASAHAKGKKVFISKMDQYSYPRECGEEDTLRLNLLLF